MNKPTQSNTSRLYDLRIEKNKRENRIIEIRCQIPQVGNSDAVRELSIERDRLRAEIREISYQITLITN